jgi:hypothetical protein
LAQSKLFDKKMRTSAKRIVRWSLLTIALMLLTYIILLVGNPNDLEGKVSSYEFFPHDRSDVLEFENGLVTMKTCCGNTYEGDYSRRDDLWTWEHQSVLRRNPPQFGFKEPVKINVEPHLFSITLKFEDGKTLNLRRRVFTSFPQ